MNKNKSNKENITIVMMVFKCDSVTKILSEIFYSRNKYEDVT